MSAHSLTNHLYLHSNNLIVRTLYEYKLKKTTSETTRNTNEAFGEGSVPVRTAQMWFQRFRQGDESLDDVKLTGRKRSLDDDTFREVVEAEPRSSARKIVQTVGKTKSTISRYLREMGKKKKMDKWVSDELTGARKNDVMSSVQLCC